MLTIPHIVFGAALGEAVADLPGAAGIAFGIGWASHYFLDSMPHWERLFGPKNDDFETDIPARQWPRGVFWSAVIDVVTAGLLLWYLIWRVPHGFNFWENPIFWGGLGAIFPDIIDNVPFWNKFIGKWPFFKQQRFVHHYMHISHEAQRQVPQYLGVVTQLIVFVFSLWILLSV